MGIPQGSPEIPTPPPPSRPPTAPLSGLVPGAVKSESRVGKPSETGEQTPQDADATQQAAEVEKITAREEVVEDAEHAEAAAEKSGVDTGAAEMAAVAEVDPHPDLVESAESLDGEENQPELGVEVQGGSQEDIAKDNTEAEQVVVASPQTQQEDVHVEKTEATPAESGAATVDAPKSILDAKPSPDNFQLFTPGGQANPADTVAAPPPPAAPTNEPWPTNPITDPDAATTQDAPNNIPPAAPVSPDGSQPPQPPESDGTPSSLDVAAPVAPVEAPAADGGAPEAPVSPDRDHESTPNMPPSPDTNTPDQTTTLEPEAAARQTVDNLSEIRNKILNPDAQDAQGQARKAEYEQLRQQMLTNNPELKQLVDQVGSDADLQGKIDDARVKGNIETAHLLEERQQRLHDALDNVATAHLIANHPELLANSNNPQETLNHMNAELTARQALAQRELASEYADNGEKAGQMEKLAKEIDENKKTEPYMMTIRQEQLNLFKDQLSQEALDSLLKENTPESRATLQKLLDLSHKDGHPLNKNTLLKSSKDLAVLGDTVAEQGTYLTNLKKAFEDKSNKKLLEELARKADYANKNSLTDAKEGYGDQLQGEITRMKLESMPNRTPEENALLKQLRQSREDFAQEKKKYDKQINQKFKNDWKGLQGAWKDVWKTLRDPKATREQKLATFGALKDNIAVLTKDTALTIGKWSLFFQVGFLFALLALEMKIANFILSQER